MINIWLMGVKWNQNKENYNVTRTCGKRAARLEGTCGDAPGRLAACDFLERPRQSSTITSSSNLHHIWYATTTFSLDKGLHAGPRELPSRAPFGTQRSLMSFNHLFTILSDSFWFCLILYINMLHSVHVCSIPSHDLWILWISCHQLRTIPRLWRWFWLKIGTWTLSTSPVPAGGLNRGDIKRAPQGPQNLHATSIYIHHIIHLHPEEVPKYSKPVAADSKPCCAK